MPALVLMIALCETGVKQLSEPMVAHIHTPFSLGELISQVHVPQTSDIHQIRT